MICIKCTKIRRNWREDVNTFYILDSDVSGSREIPSIKALFLALPLFYSADRKIRN